MEYFERETLGHEVNCDLQRYRPLAARHQACFMSGS
jgi:hypothetical protein